MTSEHGNFPLFGTKVKQVIVILYTYLNNGVEFFILHHINMGIFLSLEERRWCSGSHARLPIQGLQDRSPASPVFRMRL